MVRILIVDGHAIFRRGLIDILSETEDLLPIDEAGSGGEALQKIRNHNYDLVLLDISLADRSGLDLLQELKRSHPHLPVLIISMHPEEQYAVRALRAGASGYLNKSSAADELINAVRKVAGGGRYITSSLAEKLAASLNTENQPPHATLSNREFQVMCLIAQGKRVSEIAQQMALSVKTISTYRTRILQKMQLKNNAELTHYAITCRLINY